MGKDQESEAASLRQKAEVQLKRMRSKTELCFSESDTLKLIHELEVHQIELELQNEELVIAKAKTQELADKYTELYDFAPSGYFTLSKEGKITRLNFSGANMLGKERSHLLNRPFDFFLSYDSKSIFNQFLKNVFVSHVTESCEVNISTFGNPSIYLSFNGTVSENGEDCFVIIHDMTEQKKAEKIHKILYNISKAVLTSDRIGQLFEIIRQELNHIFDATNYFVALYNPETDTLKRIHWVDEKDEFDEWDAGKSLSGQVVKTAKTLLLKKNEIEQFARQNNISLLGTPAECWLGVPLISDEKVIGAVVIQSYTNPDEYDSSSATLLELIAQDLSIFAERSRILSDLLNAKDKAEESERLKSAFLANMSHEIRTPMNGILGFTELLKDHELTEDEKQKYISIIENSGERMLGVINDIISISKVDAGQMKVSISKTNLNEQIEYIYTFFKPEAERKGLTIHFENSIPAKETIINTDSEKLYAILTNLVKNAIKFTDVGGVEIGFASTGSTSSPATGSATASSTGSTGSTSSPAGGSLARGSHGEGVGRSEELLFYVKDTGLGISPEQKKIIFERFRQGNESLARNYDGSGLGLSISKAYVEMLGGKMWVDSEPGKGSTFYFTIPGNMALPKKKNIGSVSATTNGKENLVGKLKILIAEDDSSSELLISKTVKLLSNEIIKVRTGIEAVEACRKKPDIDLVLMDIIMPEMDGYEATRQIRKFNKEVVIIAQTALALDGDREKAIEAGCDDYISKPINNSKLIELIKTHV